MYAQRKYNVKYALLFEVYGGYISTKHVKGRGVKCFKIFNPNFEAFASYLLQKWVDVPDYTFKRIIKD